MSSLVFSLTENFLHLQQTVKRGDETHEFCAFSSANLHLSYYLAITYTFFHQTGNFVWTLCAYYIQSTLVPSR